MHERKTIWEEALERSDGDGEAPAAVWKMLIEVCRVADGRLAAMQAEIDELKINAPQQLYTEVVQFIEPSKKWVVESEHEIVGHQALNEKGETLNLMPGSGEARDGNKIEFYWPEPYAGEVRLTVLR